MLLLGLAVLCLAGCQEAAPPLNASDFSISESAALDALLREGEGVDYTGTDFDFQLYPVQLLQKDRGLYFTYTMDFCNKHLLDYKKLNIVVEFNEKLHPYLDGPDYLGEIPLKGKDGRIYEQHVITSEKQINDTSMQRERGVAEDALVLTPEDVEHLRAQPADAVMTIEAGRQKWEIPFTFTYR